MSSALYLEALLWHGHVGLAKCDGVQVDLRTFPAAALPGLAVVELRFIPEVRQCEIRESARGWRELTREERASVHGWLQRVASAARVAIDN